MSNWWIHWLMCSFIDMNIVEIPYLLLWNCFHIFIISALNRQKIIIFLCKMSKSTSSISLEFSSLIAARVRLYYHSSSRKFYSPHGMNLRIEFWVMQRSNMNQNNLDKFQWMFSFIFHTPYISLLLKCEDVPLSSSSKFEKSVWNESSNQLLSLSSRCQCVILPF